MNLHTPTITYSEEGGFVVVMKETKEAFGSPEE
jgi:hypothetical protein